MNRFSTIRGLFGATNWHLLRNQKAALREIQVLIENMRGTGMPKEKSDDLCESLEGVLEFLDVIGDYAEDVEGFAVYPGGRKQ